MKVTINGKKMEIAERTSVKDILAVLEMETKFMAVAVNLSFVPKDEYPAVLLKEGDELEVVSPQAGG